jgi:TonB family protein
MKTSAFALALCILLNATPQTRLIERQSLALVQRTLASDLDAKLPGLPFATWHNQLVGPQAGVVWQLTECGEIDRTAQDLRACVEVNASLLDGRKVIVAITVGTFKKGITGKPVFFRAVVEQDEQLYEAQQLSDVPSMLSSPEAIPAAEIAIKPRSIDLPVIKSYPMKIEGLPQVEPLLPPLPTWPPLPDSEFSPESSEQASLPPFPDPGTSPEASRLMEIRSQPTDISQSPQNVAEGVLDGKAITRVRPVYPSSAKMMNALGIVKVRITISEVGRVIQAKAISGHMALRSAVLEAAYKWVFKPTTLNGVPVKVQGILTFDFTHNSQF